jgi:4-hydroxybenzoate polyprenyltransferase
VTLTAPRPQNRVRAFLRLVMIEHSVFALPFAYIAALTAMFLDGADERVEWGTLVLVTVAMVGLRTFAMAANRVIDREIDARNPRTAGRELPSGQLSVVQVALFCAASLALFLVAVWQLAPKTHWLWPIPVAGFVIYPYLKRFTWLCHFWLGVVDGLAPVGAWVAITNHLPWEAWLLGAAVALWVAGFDLFYALFDADVDRAQGLHSIVTRFGVRGAFAGARISHAATVACLAAAGLGLHVGALYWIGVAVVAALLLYEHALVRANDLRRLDAAFFTMNGVISVAFAVFVIADAVS